MDTKFIDYLTPYKYGAPIMAPSGVKGEFDRYGVDNMRICRHNGKFYMFCIGFDGVGYRTAMALLALARTKALDVPGVRPAVDRALTWLVAMQNQDGGWAAFDRESAMAALHRARFASVSRTSKSAASPAHGRMSSDHDFQPGIAASAS